MQNTIEQKDESNQPEKEEAEHNYSIVDKKVEKKKFMTKYTIDIILRTLTLLAVSIPIILFYFQQKAERKKQTALLQINMFAELSTKIHSLLYVTTISKEQVEIANTLVYDNFPKVSLLINDSVKNKLREILFDLTAYSNIVYVSGEYDSLRESMISDLSNRITETDDNFETKWRYGLQKIDKEKLRFTYGQIERFYTSKEISDSLKNIFKSEGAFFKPCIEGLEEVSKRIESYIRAEKNFITQAKASERKVDEETRGRLEDSKINTGHAYMGIEYSIMDAEKLIENYRKFIKAAIEDLDRTFYETTNQYFKSN